MQEGSAKPQSRERPEFCNAKLHDCTLHTRQGSSGLQSHNDVALFVYLKCFYILSESRELSRLRNCLHEASHLRAPERARSVIAMPLERCDKYTQCHLLGIERQMRKVDRSLAPNAPKESANATLPILAAGDV